MQHFCTSCAHPYHSTRVPVRVTSAGAWSRLRVLVDARLVADAAGALRVAQRAQRLFVAPVRRADVGDHDRFGVAAEAVLKQPRQLAVPVRDVACTQQWFPIAIRSGAAHMTRITQGVTAYWPCSPLSRLPLVDMLCSAIFNQPHGKSLQTVCNSPVASACVAHRLCRRPEL